MVIVKRNRSIDTLKGLLIFTVVLGHVLLGTLDDNPVRYLIYSFHMPVFFFVSGYLLNVEKMKQTPIRDILTKYWRRMLKPWCVAWVVYSLYAMHGNLSLSSLLHNMYSPYYHLWFVPSLFLCILIFITIQKKTNDSNIAYTGTFCLGLFLFNLHNSPYAIITSFLSCHFLFFLVLGSLCKALIINPSRGGILICFAAILLADDTLGMPVDKYRSFFMLPICATLCIFGFLPVMARNTVHVHFLEMWGKKSLEIYLWHVIPIMVIKYFFGKNEITYYIITFTTMALFALGSHLYCKRISK